MNTSLIAVNFVAVILLITLMATSGCAKVGRIGVEQRDAAPDVTVERITQDRIRVERLGVFNDSLAYGGKRGIYIIRDLETGREYIGVSGVGISETDSRTVQKPYHTVEVEP